MISNNMFPVLAEKLKRDKEAEETQRQIDLYWSSPVHKVYKQYERWVQAGIGHA